MEEIDETKRTETGPEVIEDQVGLTTAEPEIAGGEAGVPEENMADPYEEISVLDYLKFKLNPKNFGKEILPENTPGADDTEAEDGPAVKEKPAFFEALFSGRQLVKTGLNPIFLLLSLCFAFTAQILMEPTIVRRNQMTPWVGAGFYLLCAVSFLCSFFLRKGSDDPGDEQSTVQSEDKLFDAGFRFEFLGLSLICALLAFLLFGGNRFTFLNVSVWILSLLFAALAFSPLSLREICTAGFGKLSSSFKNRFAGSMRFSAWNLLWIIVFACCAFFIFYDLDGVPVDMVSDHAEKLYDIKDILDGKNPIFFTRNTGRECFQFYFTVLIIKIFGTGLSFLSLKIGTALAGLFILPFVYKLGKMLGNRWVGLLAMLFSGISYWPIVIQRAALRFAYYPMFTAPALYFFIKGLKNRSRSSLIWAGIFLGIGLHGYSPFRIVPLAFAVFFVIYLLMDVKPGSRTNALGAFLCLVLFAFLVFLPLARVTMDMPEMVVYRSVSRLGETEKSFDASPLGIFADNVWKGLVMPFWSDGSTWVHSIVYRPALEHFTASFFFMGLLFVLMRIIRKHCWEDVCMLLSIPLLMLPSTLSLAFPAENPCLNRTAGALIPVMLIAAAGFCGTFDVAAQSLRKHTAGFIVLSVAAAALLGSILSNNFDLVFRRFAYEYNRSAWNTSQIGSVIKGFADSVGSYETAFVIPNPHWVDTRLVGINAGDPGKDYAFDKSLLSSLPSDGLPRLFIYRGSDVEAGEAVRTRYPNGIEQLHTGPYEGKDFYSYIAFSDAGGY
ncbi:MAG: glycosyltransferase family 39 protein [Anaerolineaceae bacterium]|nr:glycosyltransferase family 39 protein [Anaerolineaceae bacterium]